MKVLMSHHHLGVASNMADSRSAIPERKRESPREVFTTADMHLACTLMARDHRVIEGRIQRESDGTLYITFPNDDVKDDVQQWSEGRVLKADLAEAH